MSEREIQEALALIEQYEREIVRDIEAGLYEEEEAA